MWNWVLQIQYISFFDSARVLPWHYRLYRHFLQNNFVHNEMSNHYGLGIGESLNHFVKQRKSSLWKESIKHFHQHLAVICSSWLCIHCVFVWAMTKILFMTVWRISFVKLQMSSPTNSGWRKRPAVPRMHTRTKTHRNILSITMATYFQSSWTCQRRHSKNIFNDMVILSYFRWKNVYGKGLKYFYDCERSPPLLHFVVSCSLLCIWRSQ